jgi:hypothetical protein
MRQQASASFLKKRSKKLLVIWATGVESTSVQTSKSFLRAFFQKSAACLLAFSRGPA